MADIAVQKFVDQLTGQTDPTATLAAAPTATLRNTARDVTVARQQAKLPRVTDELIDQVTGGERPRDLTGILINNARAIDSHPAAAAAVSSGDTIRGVADQRGLLMAYTGAGAAVQQFGEFGKAAVSQVLDADLKTFLTTCELVVKDPASPEDLRAEASNALLIYQTQVDTLSSLRDDVGAHRRAVIEEANSQLQLTATTSDQLAQVNGFLTRFEGGKQ